MRANQPTQEPTTRRWEKAFEEGKRTIEILKRMKISDKGYSWTFYTIVDSLLKLKRIDEAESWAMRGIRYDDMNPDSYWLLTVIHFIKKDFQKVLNYLIDKIQTDNPLGLPLPA